MWSPCKVWFMVLCRGASLSDDRNERKTRRFGLSTRNGNANNARYIGLSTRLRKGFHHLSLSTFTMCLLHRWRFISKIITVVMVKWELSLEKLSELPVFKNDCLTSLSKRSFCRIVFSFRFKGFRFSKEIFRNKYLLLERKRLYLCRCSEVWTLTGSIINGT